MRRHRDANHRNRLQGKESSRAATIVAGTSVHGRDMRIGSGKVVSADKHQGGRRDVPQTRSLLEEQPGRFEIGAIRERVVFDDHPARGATIRSGIVTTGRPATPKLGKCQRGQVAVNHGDVDWHTGMSQRRAKRDPPRCAARGCGVHHL